MLLQLMHQTAELFEQVTWALATRRDSQQCQHSSLSPRSSVERQGRELYSDPLSWPSLDTLPFSCFYFPHLKKCYNCSFISGKVEKKVSTYSSKPTMYLTFICTEWHMHQETLPLFLLFRLVATQITTSMAQAAWLLVCNNTAGTVPPNASHCQNSADSKNLSFKAGS